MQEFCSYNSQICYYDWRTNHTSYHIFKKKNSFCPRYAIYVAGRLPESDFAALAPFPFLPPSTHDLGPRLSYYQMDFLEGVQQPIDKLFLAVSSFFFCFSSIFSILKAAQASFLSFLLNLFLCLFFFYLIFVLLFSYLFFMLQTLKQYTCKMIKIIEDHYLLSLINSVVYPYFSSVF